MQKGKLDISDIIKGKEIMFQSQLHVNHSKGYKSVIFRSGKTTISLSYDKTMLFITTDKIGDMFGEFKISFYGKIENTELMYGTARVSTLLDWRSGDERVPHESVTPESKQVKIEENRTPKAKAKQFAETWKSKPELFTHDFCMTLKVDDLQNAYISFREFMAQDEDYEDAVCEIKKVLSYRMGGYKEFNFWRDQI